ncbi:response regulator receiver domain [Mesorhizobium sp.]|uniref:response regulator receiver domain n=1 Tax=Mesorhizobium sp. TaxID=1871066 RepID=UPI000FE8B6BE|nr:response regulator receiver domain [Mesorhizobium sp.]RWD71077.1 MAG: hypothetical protein EOS37_12765 [Mesorhizobium sp.]TIV32676.1 MAG: hypothetical protein E5V90_02075 [Mesorhizobium sp.]
MNSAAASFHDDQLAAARAFAHTLIVVDDEAFTEPETSTPPVATELVKPGRQASVITSRADKRPIAVPATRHPLDATSLIETAMSLGLVCSVLRPRKGISPTDHVANASRKADILCVDWEIHNDSGRTAVEIIKSVIAHDDEFGGRLRLIAIYTGIPERAKIFDSVLSGIPDATKKRRGIQKRGNYIVSRDGLRIVWLLKTGGVTRKALAENTVPESGLPERLQNEFSYLSDGLLTNVALATIASIRDATHHVLSQFQGRMDGPFFHHRSAIEIPAEAGDYAVSVVLSELKNVADMKGIADKYAGEAALSRRIENMLGGKPSIDVNVSHSGKPQRTTLSVGNICLFVSQGSKASKAEITKSSPMDNGSYEKLPLLFFGSEKKAIEDTLRFAILGSLKDYPSKIPRGAVPTLSLGTILKDRQGRFYLCVQASCDSVRIDKRTAFLLASLQKIPPKQLQENILGRHSDHIIPIPKSNSGKVDFVGLALPRKPYTEIVAVPFDPNIATQTVQATKSPSGSAWVFSASGALVSNAMLPRYKGPKEFVWVADLKKRRALKTVHLLAQSMGRLGYDEFEPLRKKN